MGAVCAPILGGNPLDEETLNKIKALVADDLKEFGEKYTELYKIKFIQAVKDSAKHKGIKSTADDKTVDVANKLAPARWYTPKARADKKIGAKTSSKKKVQSDVPLRSKTLQVALKSSTSYFPKHVTVNGNYSLTIKKDEADKDTKQISFLYYKAEKDSEREKTIKVYYEEEQEEQESEAAPNQEVVYRFQFSDDNELENWLDVLEQTTKNGPSHLDSDPVKSESFLEAYNALRLKYSFAEDVQPIVGPAELLSKLLVRIVNKEILNQKYAEIQAPIEQCTPAFQDVFRATVGRMIGSSVRASFAIASSIIDTVADKVRSGFEVALDKVKEVEQSVHDKIVTTVGNAAKALGSVIESAVAAVIKPALQPLIDGLRTVITKITELINKAVSVINEALGLDDIRNFFTKIRKQIADVIQIFVTSVESLGKIIPIPEAVQSIQDLCQGLGDLANAVFESLEHLVVDIIFPRVAAAVNSIASDIKIVIENGKITVQSFVEVIKKTFNDCIKALVNDCKHIVNDFFSVLLVPSAEKQWKSLVVEPVQKLNDELKSSIPESVQDFVNTDEVIGVTLDDVWRAAIGPVLKPTTDFIYTSLDEVTVAAIAA